jgi:hypothetical protein
MRSRSGEFSTGVGQGSPDIIDSLRKREVVLLFASRLAVRVIVRLASLPDTVEPQDDYASASILEQANNDSC